MGMEREAGQQIQERDKVIIRTSMIGIGANLFLAAFKAGIGLLSNSIAVLLDAVNNLSDALSSVITIIGTKLAGKKPDKKHPLGYGRVEYLSAMLVAALVLYAGITSLIESVKKILQPERADYSLLSLVIIAMAVVVKLILGRYVKTVGENVKSGSLIASGSDASFDAILSASVLVSALIFLATGLSLEAYVGVIISVVIIKSGIEMMSETLDEILGKRADRELTRSIKQIVMEEEGVLGVFDLFVHSYGPEQTYASAHIEVPDTYTAEDVDQMTRTITAHVFYHTGVIMTAIGIYSRNTTGDEAAVMRERVHKIALGHKGVLQMHGFHVDIENKTASLDIIIDFDVEDQEALYRHISDEIHAAYPEYQFTIIRDVDL